MTSDQRILSLALTSRFVCPNFTFCSSKKLVYQNININMGDRSGSREPKLSSLKKSKKNPGAPAAKVKKVAKAIPVSSQTQPPPQLKVGKYFDCGVALLSRQFDRDRDRVLIRAADDKVAGLLAWFSDIEKQQTIADLCKSHAGFAYFLTGVHPDNIERTNKKSHDGWIEKVEELARRPECIGILSGLNLTRDIGTHFAQESVLRSSCAAAQKAILPLVIHVPGTSSLERAIEILKEEGMVVTAEDAVETGSIGTQRRVLLHDPVTACGLEASKLQTAISCGLGFIVSAVGLTDLDPAVREKAQACVQQLPLTHVLTQTDSPWRTPQNIPDVYLRTLRNEPCNMEFVNQAVAEVFGMAHELDRFSQLVKQNAVEIFGLETHASAFDHGSELSSALSQTHLSSTASSSIAASKLAETVGVQSDIPSAASAVEEEVEEVDDDDNDNEDDDDDAEPESSSFYGCIKCRTRLFEGSFVSKHALDTSKTVFKDGEEGMCQSVVFVPCAGTADLSSRTSLAVAGEAAVSVAGGFSAIECKGCGSKLGKFYAHEAHCACGAILKGPIARLLSAKVRDSISKISKLCHYKMQQTLFLLLIMQILIYF